MTSRDAVMEQTWGRAFTHESGHAIMAVLQEIPCRGVYYEYHGDAGKFCTLADLPEPAAYSKNHYLFLTAGTAAEEAIYGNPDEDAAKSDRVGFATPGAPALEETIAETRSILSGRKRQIKSLVAQLKAKMRVADYDIGRLPTRELNGKKYAILLSNEEVEATVRQD